MPGLGFGVKNLGMWFGVRGLKFRLWNFDVGLGDLCSCLESVVWGKGFGFS